MTAKRKIELLAPARDLACGIEAIRHGADAVYIGGPAFGARAAAANSVDDIRQLCDFAHPFNAKVYVTLNTILYDDELAAAVETVRALYDVGVDALIVQDMALLELKRRGQLPPIALHASTQMDNRTVEKAEFLAAAGFEQIVLARELSLDEIRRIHQAVTVPLEAFVHGALCVSYSGRCYASQYCFGRSANRGRCAQFCRLPFDLIDGDGRTVLRDKHLLSLRDMNRSDDLEAMMDAGVSSFKIEGRLKDVDYVKNVTVYYRQRLDAILARRGDDYERSSAGASAVTFTPQLAKSFNRGFTDYFLHGRRSEKMQNFFSPKSMGEEIGTVAHTDRRTGAITLRLLEGVTLAAGDGLCFVADGALQGFRVNTVEGNRVFPAAPLLARSLGGGLGSPPLEHRRSGDRRPVTPPRINIAVGTTVYRNVDYRFEQLLAKPTATRTLALDIELGEIADGYRLTLTDETGRTASLDFAVPHEEGKTPQQERITSQLTRLGGTIFSPRHVTLSLHGNRFIPASQLAAWRREGVERLMGSCEDVRCEDVKTYGLGESGGSLPHLQGSIVHVNVSNAMARAFYEEVGAEQIETAYELQPSATTPLMTCKYCLRFALGACLRERQQAQKLKEPLALRLADGRRFALKSDCKNCQMLVYATTK